MHETDRPTRRDFLGHAGLAALAAPTILSASARGGPDRPAPSERITLGFIGVGKMNRGHLRAFLGRPAVQVVAVCDVDATRRESARQMVEDRYEKDGRAGSKGCAAYDDFRELLARDDVDAVVIATPDHWHAIPAWRRAGRARTSTARSR
jgi:ornithine cyclodeaminase/alanine dehydrogenase-like protein (mu-crystallin family)